MTRQRYFPASISAQIPWLENFWNKLRGHTPALGIPQAKCDGAVADSRWCIYMLGAWLANEKAHAKGAVQTVDEALYGPQSAAPFVLPPHTPAPMPGAVPGAVPPLPAVLPTPPGALDRLFALVQEIKTASTYTEAMGMDLGIVGPEKSGPDMETVTPSLRVARVGDTVQVDWNFGGYGAFLDMIELQVDRGQGWVTLTFDTTPGYTDTAPQPATLTQWKYRGIYRVSDQRVGVWSAEVAVVLA